jgi:2-keto-4-pentenoate hydratase/2-oxohepta-3-ene-1,7-dioic acid hydratase in catechol pathway
MRFEVIHVDGSRHLTVHRDGAHYVVEGAADVSQALRELGPERLMRAAEAASVPITGDVVAPVSPSKIIAIGLNYLDHIRETGLDRPERPLVFAKFPSAVIGQGQAIEIDRSITERVDWEIELAVVIGTMARDVAVDRALDVVFGYTVANDVSARDVQFGDGQWVRGKSLDTFCPLGPAVVTADAIGDPQNLELRTTVNGETMQDSSTSEMLFGVAELVAFCSRNFTLCPGDVILTGTPWGCGEFMTPQRSLASGDVVVCSIEGIGDLVNPVV